MTHVRINVSGQSVRLLGDENPISSGAMDALISSGAQAVNASLPDLLLVSFPLLPELTGDVSDLLNKAQQAAAEMAERGSGRIIFILSAAAAMPMRRHPQFSVAMASALTTMRTLAMAHGPHVLVNAVGVGAVGEPLISGDAAMPGHAAVQRAGTTDEAVAAILFFCEPLNTYTTGQMLSVDGGWQAGYGRNF